MPYFVDYIYKFCLCCVFFALFIVIGFYWLKLNANTNLNIFPEIFTVLKPNDFFTKGCAENFFKGFYCEKIKF